MPSRVLWLLDNETDDRTFERLCTSLMYRYGYRGIVPVGGTADRGRDAEAEVAMGHDRGAERVFFQYTLERRWESKLSRELKKVRRNGHSIDKYVFITRGRISGASRDKHTKSVFTEYGWKLELFDREWLRLQLEEVHPNAARAYLHLAETEPPFSGTRSDVLPRCEGQTLQAVWRSLEGRHEAAIPELRNLLSATPSGLPPGDIWAALAWCYYSLYNYKEALDCIENALGSNATSHRYRVIKACILCEEGAEIQSRPMLVMAKAIFQELAVDATEYRIHYNLGNALSALGDYVQAREAYEESLNFNDKVAEVWKNLGTCHFHLGNHERELECYDTALRLNPHLAHALISKANTTAHITHDYEKAIQLLDQAVEAEPNIGKQWPHFHWWRAHYLFQLDRLDEALLEANEGQRRHPEQARILDLKARILSKLWRRLPCRRSTARSFFLTRLEASPSEIPSLIELAEISAADSCSEDVREYLVRAFNAASGCSPISVSNLRTVRGNACLLALAHHFPAYVSYRKAHPLINSRNGADDRRWCEFPLLWVAFGIVFSELVSLAPARESSTDQVVAFFAKARQAVVRAVGLVASSVAIEYDAADVTRKTDVMSFSLAFLGQAAMNESAWLSGHLPASNGVPDDVFAEARDRAEQGEDLRPLQKGIIDAVLHPLNRRWKLFPSGKCRKEEGKSGRATLAKGPRRPRFRR